MKLIYFWVEKYKGLNNFEMNLDSNYEVEIKNMGIINSTIKINQHKIPNIFGDNILGITALVGRNGSGKSSILELLSLDKGGLSSKVVYIYSTNIEDEYIIETNFLDLNSFKEFTINENEIFKKYFYKYNLKTGEKSFLSGEKEEIRVIRYKPDMKSGFQNKDSHSQVLKYNISSEINYLEIFKIFQKKEDIFKEYKNVVFKIGINKTLKKYDELDYRILNLLESLKNKEDIMVPLKTLKEDTKEIKIYSNKEIFIDNYLTYNININFKEIIDEYLIISEKSNSSELLKLIELNPVSKSQIFGLSESEELKILKDKLIDKNFDYEKEKILNRTWCFLKKIKCLKRDMPDNYYINIVNENAKKINKFLNLIKNLDDNFFKKEDNIEINFIQNYSKNEKSKIFDILKLIDELPDQNNENFEMLERVTDFFYSFLQGLSDGERMYISLLSSIIELTPKITKKKQYSTILLDEVELYLHPEWMRKILSIYIKYLNKVKNHKFQLILATHSPFIISDLPKECVILLEKGTSGIESKKCQMKTFGANIFDLYNETFFLSSTFGEFATKKIIEILSMEEITKENEEMIDYIVDSVGEKLIRNQLKKLLENKKRI